ncbi:uncharacterized protein LOC133325147 [Musca vetustissima]|uniref:uncharacterized protein LOC133325147 n=1 Tax=Musca vetustissima TaxID=27455 RepID=UPI002AB6044D|nr:uncharacterized protein LOC133325147 [Musca vetustissima]
MGSPELPSDGGEEDLRPTHIVHHPVAAVASDDSDNDSMNDYDGYQPLAMDENHQGYVQHGMDDDEEEDADNNDDESPEVTYGDPNLPPVESIDAEVEREVWSQPRPQELQIELDSNKTQQILTAMANFSLPNMAVPSWADGVPEERWKEELLERIRQRKPASGDAQMDVDKQTKVD